MIEYEWFIIYIYIYYFLFYMVWLLMNGVEYFKICFDLLNELIFVLWFWFVRNFGG